ncbi:MAG: class I SAM-dependent rRNA methyltransferase [Planctomycetales bacterium]|nr:class I SAM-dependent rRNA methyltransferase [Planctomycetales bacterium]
MNQRPPRGPQRGRGPGRGPARGSGAGASPFHRGPLDLSPLPMTPADNAVIPRAIVNVAIQHPSIFRKRLVTVDPTARPGDWVKVETEEGEHLGFGLFNPKSEIAIRLVFPARAELTSSLWDTILDRSISIRRDTLRLDSVTDAYRLIHAEGDGLPGLVVDRFGDVLSVEVFQLGMWRRARDIVAALAQRLGTEHWLIQTSPHVMAQEGFDAPPLTSERLRDSVTITEHGTRFRVRFEGSHKTGFFCDQRENRRKLASFCRDKTVLDLCCYSGGFSVQAKKLGGAAEVTGVELDEVPLRLAQENANLNQARVKFVQADVFPYMRDMIRAGRTYDVVVLDPPKLIRSRAELDEGTRKHFDLNRLAMQLVAPGGMLLSCTCAGLLSREAFQKLLCAASRQAGDPIGEAEGDFRRRGPREMRFLEFTGASEDHPVASNFPESEYLNAAWMRLD